MTKMTNVKAIEFVLTNVADLPAEVREKFEAMKASFEKKASAERKPTATQTENAGFKAEILDFLVGGQKVLITDIMKGVPSLANLSNQRVSAIVRQLVLAGEVIRTEDKRKAYFSIAE